MTDANLSRMLNRRLTRREELKLDIAALAALGSLFFPWQNTGPKEKPPFNGPEIQPTKIHGVDVFGLTEEINDESHLQALYQQFERNWYERGARDKADPDLRYMEIYVDREVYQRYEELGAGGFVKYYANRHMEKINEIISQGIPTTRVRGSLKRIVVLGPNFRERDEGWSRTPTKDPDGRWVNELLLADIDGRRYIKNDIRNWSMFGGSNYNYDSVNHFDLEFLHETFHDLFELNDVYRFDWDRIPSPLIPEDYMTYDTYRLYLMAGPLGLEMDTWSITQLEYDRRIGQRGRDRNWLKWWNDSLDYFFYTLPGRTIVHCLEPNGNPLNGASYKLIQVPREGKRIPQAIRVVREGKLDSSGRVEIEAELFHEKWSSESNTTEHKYTHLLVVEDPSRNTYVQPINALSLGVLYFSGFENEAQMEVQFRNYRKPKDRAIVINEKGETMKDFEKLFHFEDSNGQTIKDIYGAPIQVKLGEFGPGVYQLRDFRESGLRLLDFSASGYGHKNGYGYPYGNPIRLWFQRGISRWGYERLEKLQPTNEGGEIQSIVPLPHSQALVHRYKPAFGYVYEEGGETIFKPYLLEEFQIILGETR